MSDNSQSASSGIGFFGLLTILFIGLKLTHNIDWGWEWVLAPLWMPLTLIIVVFLVVVVGAFVFGVLQHLYHKLFDTLISNN